jgi:hypothetical protein
MTERDSKIFKSFLEFLNMGIKRESREVRGIRGY